MKAILPMVFLAGMTLVNIARPQSCIQTTDCVPDVPACSGEACGEVSITTAPALPNDCQNLAPNQATEVYLSSHSTRSVQITFKTRFRIFTNVSGVDQWIDVPTSLPEPPISVPPAAPVISGPYILDPNEVERNPISGSCSAYYDAPSNRTFHVVHEPTAKYYPVTPNGTGNSGGSDDHPCVLRAPALVCTSAPDDLPDGEYRFRGTRFFYGGEPMCLTVDADGNYKEYVCTNTDQQAFHLGERVGKCYKIRQKPPTLWLALTDFHNDNSDTAQLFGWGDTQLYPWCSYDATRVQWQIRESAPGSNVYELRDSATGKCMQIDGSDLDNGGKVNAIKCRGSQYEAWALERYVGTAYEFSLQPGATMTINVVFNQTVLSAVSLHNKLDPPNTWFGPWPGCGNYDNTHPKTMTYTNTGGTAIPFTIDAGNKESAPNPTSPNQPWHPSNGIVTKYSGTMIVIEWPSLVPGIGIVGRNVGATKITISVSAGQLP